MYPLVAANLSKGWKYQKAYKKNDKIGWLEWRFAKTMASSNKCQWKCEEFYRSRHAE
jgi:hypothetical protein